VHLHHHQGFYYHEIYEESVDYSDLAAAGWEDLSEEEVGTYGTHDRSEKFALSIAYIAFPCICLVPVC
jgi:hypothetical protein